MNLSLKLSVLALGFLAIPAANAEDTMYFGLGYSEISVNPEGSSDVKPTAVVLKLGSQVNQNFAVEGRYATSLESDEVSVLGVPVDVELDNYYGVYAKGIIPLVAGISAYGLVGYTNIEMKSSVAGFSATGSEDDFSYGAGLDFALGKTVSLNLEWAKLISADNYEVEAVTLGANFMF